MKGMPGNRTEAVEEQALPKRYYGDGKTAAKAFNRDSEVERYWRQHEVENGRFVMWQQLGGRS